MSTPAPSKSARIRELNDRFRLTFAGGRVMVTAGVEALPLDKKAAVIHRVRTFDNFDRGNDPHHEHDFGSIDADGTTYFFKIDYYDLALSAHSPDPADPAVTTRVLTIMLASEY